MLFTCGWRQFGAASACSSTSARSGAWSLFSVVRPSLFSILRPSCITTAGFHHYGVISDGLTRRVARAQSHSPLLPVNGEAEKVWIKFSLQQGVLARQAAQCAHGPGMGAEQLLAEQPGALLPAAARLLHWRPAGRAGHRAGDSTERLHPAARAVTARLRRPALCGRRAGSAGRPAPPTPLLRPALLRRRAQRLAHNCPDLQV